MAADRIADNRGNDIGQVVVVVALLPSVNVLSNRNENNSQDFPSVRYRFDDRLSENLNSSLVVVFDDALNLTGEKKSGL